MNRHFLWKGRNIEAFRQPEIKLSPPAEVPPVNKRHFRKKSQAMNKFGSVLMRNETLRDDLPVVKIPTAEESKPLYSSFSKTRSFHPKPLASLAKRRPSIIGSRKPHKVQVSRVSRIPVPVPMQKFFEIPNVSQQRVRPRMRSDEGRSSESPVFTVRDLGDLEQALNRRPSGSRSVDPGQDRHLNLPVLKMEKRSPSGLFDNEGKHLVDFNTSNFMLSPDSISKRRLRHHMDGPTNSATPYSFSRFNDQDNFPPPGNVNVRFSKMGIRPGSVRATFEATRATTMLDVLKHRRVNQRTSNGRPFTREKLARAGAFDILHMQKGANR